MAPALGAPTPAPGAGVAGALSFRLPIVEAGTLDATSVALDGTPIAATLGADRALTGTFDTHALVDGVHHLSGAASDKSGNVGTFDVPVRVDNSGPALGSVVLAKALAGVATVAVPLADATGIAAASATVAGMPLSGALAADGTYRVRVDTRLLADGRHDLQLAASDNLGNPSTLTVPFVTDNTAPRLRVSAPRRVFVGARVVVRVHASDPTAGIVRRPRISFGDGASAYVPTTHRYRRVGRFRVRVSVVDAAGNRSSWTRVLRVVRRS
jgi:hypothetical protein